VKKILRESPCFEIIVLPLTACFFCGIGNWVIVPIARPMIYNEYEEIAAMPATPDIATGEKAVLTGILSDNKTISTDPEIDTIAQYELIAYQVETYSKGSWSTTRELVAILRMEVNGQTVAFRTDTETTFDGIHEFYVDQGDLRDGSRRVRGFRNHDQVTIIAKRTAEDIFLAQELYGGTRDDLLDAKSPTGEMFLLLILSVLGWAIMSSIIRSKLWRNTL